MCARWVLQNLPSKKKAREEPFLLSCWHILKLKERPYSRLLQQMKSGSIILNWKQRAIHRMLPSFSQEEKSLKIFHKQGSSWSLSSGVVEWFLWMQCQARRQIWCLHQCTERTRGNISCEFGNTRMQQKSSFSMTVQSCTQVWRLGKPSHNLAGQCYLFHPTATVWHPKISTCLEQEGCYPRSLRLITKWFAQRELSYMSRTRNGTNMSYSHLFLVSRQ